MKGLLNATHQEAIRSRQLMKEVSPFRQIWVNEAICPMSETMLAVGDVCTKVTLLVFYNEQVGYGTGRLTSTFCLCKSFSSILDGQKMCL